MNWWERLKNSFRSQTQALSEVTVARGQAEAAAGQTGARSIGGVTPMEAQPSTYAEVAARQIPQPEDLQYMGPNEDPAYLRMLKAWNRPFATANLLSDPTTWEDSSSVLEGIKKAWNRSADVSYAQSLLTTPAGVALPFTAALAAPLQGVDIYDDLEVEETFETGSAKPWSGEFNPNKLTSGFVDLIYGVTAGDPFVVGGLATKSARLKYLDPEFNVLDDYAGPQRSKYEAEVREQGRQQTILEQQRQRQSELLTRQAQVQARLEEAKIAARPDLGPEPTWEQAFEEAKKLSAEGTERQVLVEMAGGRQLGFNKMNSTEQRLYDEFGVIPLRLIEQQLDPNIPLRDKPFGNLQEDVFYTWFRTGSEEGVEMGGRIGESPWTIDDYRSAAKPDPRKPELSTSQLRGEETVTRRNADGSFTTYTRKKNVGPQYVEVPWLRGGTAADESELMRRADSIYEEWMDQYDAAARYIEPELQQQIDKWDAERAALETELTKLSDEIPAVQARVEELRQKSMPRLAKNMDHFVRQVVDYDMKASDIAKHRWVSRWSSDPYRAGQIIEYAAKSGDPTDIVDSLLVMRGDQAAYDRLASRRELLAMSLKRIEGERNIVQEVLDSGSEFVPLTDYRSRPEYQAQLKRELDLILEEDAFLRKVVGDFKRTPEGGIQALENTGFGILAAARGPAKIQAIESMRARRAMRKAYYSFAPRKSWRPWQAADDWDIVPYQANPLLRPVYVAEFVGSGIGKELPSGIVPLRGIEAFEVGPETTAWLNSVKAWNTKQGQTIKQDWFDRLNAAPESSADPNVLTRAQVLDEMEDAAFRASLKEYGIDPSDTVESLRAELDRYGIKYDAKAEEFLMTRRGGKTYPEARLLLERKQAIEEFTQDIINRYKQKRAIASSNIDEMGFYVTEDGGIGLSPLVGGQLADFHFLPDMGLWDSYVKDNSSLFNAAIDSKTYEKLTASDIAKTEIKSAREMLSSLYNDFDRVWRPSVLIRLGYTQRNIITELLKVGSVLDGGIVELYKNAPQAAKNWSKNRWDRFYSMKAEAAMNVKMAQQGIQVTGKKHRVDVEQYQQFLDENLETARAEYAEAVNLNNKELIDAAERKLADAQTDITSFGEYLTRQGQKGNRYADGKGTIVLSDREIMGAYGGPEGEQFRRLISSGARMMEDLAPVGAKMMAKQLELVQSGSWGALRPDAPNYYEELAGILNRQFRNSEVLKMLYSGMDDMKILSWLRSAAGKNEMAKVRWPESALKIGDWKVDSNGNVTWKGPAPTPEGYLAQIKNAYSRYLPNEAARSLWLDAVAEGRDLTAQELRTFIPQEQAGVIHGRLWEEQIALTLPQKIRQVLLPDESENWRSTLLTSLGGAETFGGGDILSAGGAVGGVAGAVLGNNWTKFTQTAFKYLGVLPEDAFISHPFGRALYEGEMSKLLSKPLVLGEELRPDTVLRMQTAARQYALRESRSILYRIVRKSSAANALVALSPFFQAQMHTIKAWSRIAYEKPAALAVLANTYARAHQAEFVEQDPLTGEYAAVFNMPESWWQNTDNRLLPNFLEQYTDKALIPVRDMLRAKSKLRFGLQSFNYLQPGWRGDQFASALIQSFGIGPAITYPISQTIKAFPDMDEKLSQATGLPIPARSILEAFVPIDTITVEGIQASTLPPVLRRIRSTIGGLRAMGGDKIYSAEDMPADWAFHSKYFFDYRWAREQLGIDKPLSDEERWNLAAKDTAYFFGMRLAANLLSPNIPQYDGALTPYINIWRQLQNEDPVNAFDRFYSDYPEFVNITASLTRNETGSSPTADAVFMYNNNKDLASDLALQLGPEFVQIVTNRQFEDIEYDPAARAWQIENEFRGTTSGAESTRVTQTRKGWADYRNLIAFIDSKLDERGLYSLSQSGADDLAELKRRWVDRQQVENPAWFFDGWSVSDREGWRKGVMAVNAVLQDKKFMSYQGKDSWLWSAQDWLTGGRQFIVDKLQERDKAGGSSNIDAKANTDLRLLRDKIVKELSDENPTFGKMYVRFLDNDKFLPVDAEVAR